MFTNTIAERMYYLISHKMNNTTIQMIAFIIVNAIFQASVVGLLVLMLLNMKGELRPSSFQLLVVVLCVGGMISSGFDYWRISKFTKIKKNLVEKTMPTRKDIGIYLLTVLMFVTVFINMVMIYK